MLTIAIICKNEEKNIKRCLDSVFACIQQISLPEILLVDSFSTDQTILIAERYPIKIIRLREDWPHSPAAGRYTAFVHTQGRYTLCLDADMELIPGFLEKAIAFLETKPKAAAVTGILENLFHHDKYKPLNVRIAGSPPEEVHNLPIDYEGQLDSVPGAGLFRTSAVKEVGNFHPYLRAEEEYELCQRLRLSGYDLWYIPHKIARHYGYEQNGFKEMWRRQKNGFMGGIGEMFKWSCMTGFFRTNFHRFWQHITIGGYLAVLPPILIVGYFVPLVPAVWCSGVALLVLAFAIKKKSFPRGMAAFCTKALIGLNIWYMLPHKVRPPDSYPSDVIIIDRSQPKPKGPLSRN